MFDDNTCCTQYDTCRECVISECKLMAKENKKCCCDNCTLIAVCDGPCMSMGYLRDQKYPAKTYRIRSATKEPFMTACFIKEDGKKTRSVEDFYNSLCEESTEDLVEESCSLIDSAFEDKQEPAWKTNRPTEMTVVSFELSGEKHERA